MVFANYELSSQKVKSFFAHFLRTTIYDFLGNVDDNDKKAQERIWHLVTPTPTPVIVIAKCETKKITLHTHTHTHNTQPLLPPVSLCLWRAFSLLPASAIYADAVLYTVASRTTDNGNRLNSTFLFPAELLHAVV